MIEGKHGVRLATTEVSLELDDGIAALTGQPADATDEQTLQALSDVGPAKELHRIAVLRGPFTQMHLP